MENVQSKKRKKKKKRLIFIINIIQFRRISPSFFKDVSNQRKYFDSLKEVFGIKNLNDWHQVKRKELYLYGCTSILNLYEGNK